MWMPWVRGHAEVEVVVTLAANLYAPGMTSAWLVRILMGTLSIQDGRYLGGSGFSLAFGSMSGPKGSSAAGQSHVGVDIW